MHRSEQICESTQNVMPRTFFTWYMTSLVFFLVAELDTGSDTGSVGRRKLKILLDFLDGLFIG